MLVKLYYRTTEYRGFDDFVKTRPEYIRVMEFPLVEMTGHTPVSWAQDFKDATRTSIGIKRTPKAGDVMMCGETTYLFVPSNEPMEQSHIAVPGYADTAVIKITPTLSETIKMIFDTDERGFA